MQNLNLRNLSTKDKMLITKALTDIANAIYKDNTTFILNQIIKNGNYESDFGKFYTQTNQAKTIQEIINANEKKIKELQEENATLEKYEDKTVIAKEETIILKSKHSETADDIAMQLLQDIIANLDSKRLSKSASKR